MSSHASLLFSLVVKRFLTGDPVSAPPGPNLAAPRRQLLTAFPPGGIPPGYFPFYLRLDVSSVAEAAPADPFPRRAIDRSMTPPSIISFTADLGPDRPEKNQAAGIPRDFKTGCSGPKTYEQISTCDQTSQLPRDLNL